VPSDLGGADEVLKAASGTAEAVLAKAGMAPSELMRAAVGTPGMVELPSRQITLAPQIAGW
jgi:hypothetical protein